MTVITRLETEFDEALYQQYIPRRLGIYDGRLRQLFTRYFTKEGNLIKFETRKKAFLEKLDQSHASNLFHAFNYLREVPSVNRLLSNYTDKDFEHFNLKRILALHLLVSKNKSIDEARSLLLIRGADAELPNKLTYFYHSLHIYISDTIPLDLLVMNLKRYLLYSDHDLTGGELRIVKNFADSLSPFEIEIIRKFQ